MRTLIYITLLSTGVLMACSGKKEQTTESEAVVMEGRSHVLESYLSIKNALVNSDAEKARSAAEILENSLLENNMNNQLIQAARGIASSDDLSLQRASFKTLTEGLISTLKENSVEEGVYVQYCPMAFDNTGANWISLTEDIKNPYFGDKMLTCGRVKEKL